MSNHTNPMIYNIHNMIINICIYTYAYIEYIFLLKNTIKYISKKFPGGQISHLTYHCTLHFLFWEICFSRERERETHMWQWKKYLYNSDSNKNVHFLISLLFIHFFFVSFYFKQLPKVYIYLYRYIYIWRRHFMSFFLALLSQEKKNYKT